MFVLQSELGEIRELHNNHQTGVTLIKNVQVEDRLWYMKAWNRVYIFKVLHAALQLEILKMNLKNR